MRVRISASLLSRRIELIIDEIRRAAVVSGREGNLDRHP